MERTDASSSGLDRSSAPRSRSLADNHRASSSRSACASLCNDYRAAARTPGPPAPFANHSCPYGRHAGWLSLHAQGETASSGDRVITPGIITRSVAAGAGRARLCGQPGRSGSCAAAVPGSDWFAAAGRAVSWSWSSRCLERAGSPGGHRGRRCLGLRILSIGGRAGVRWR